MDTDENAEIAGSVAWSEKTAMVTIFGHTLRNHRASRPCPILRHNLRTLHRPKGPRPPRRARNARKSPGEAITRAGTELGNLDGA
eukprot:CAMPEP_0169387428 /NCGR_PEP_ID=MMETSP1017-20121227/45379_1 /TAXON_ID=342587 /ORGANISM="Karlodinium micrum, Strain CCMP2283" /LENGTH=84 /DNA_ID=CAMNT_0009488899 /DNA_START=185 /DNA_END=435 /DNA_ORIENTATION=+